MTRGTRSMLYGVHQCVLHPLLVTLAWRKLYRRWPGWAELMAIIFHDCYWGMPEIDGPVGKTHPMRGAKWARVFGGARAEELALFHSRSFSWAADRNPSALSAPDKYSILMEPRWSYLLRARWSGELYEFASRAVRHKEIDKEENWYDQYVMNVKKEFGGIYLPLNNGEFTRIALDAPEEFWSQKWSANTKTPGRTYAYCSKTGHSGKKHQQLHRAVAGTHDPELWVDHINGNTLDNVPSNLRICAPAEAGRNLSKWGTKTSSKFKGVSFHKQSNRWRAYITLGAIQKYLGGHELEETAARAYDAAAVQLFGKFAKLNFANADHPNSAIKGGTKI